MFVNEISVTIVHQNASQNNIIWHFMTVDLFEILHEGIVQAGAVRCGAEGDRLGIVNNLSLWLFTDSCHVQHKIRSLVLRE